MMRIRQKVHYKEGTIDMFARRVRHVQDHHGRTRCGERLLETRIGLGSQVQDAQQAGCGR